MNITFNMSQKLHTVQLPPAGTGGDRCWTASASLRAVPKQLPDRMTTV